MKLELIPLSSLTKVFADEKPAAAPYDHATCLRNETFSFQIAYYLDLENDAARGSAGLYFVLESDLPVTARAVGLEPVNLPTYPGAVAAVPEQYLRTAPGLYPDPLLPVELAQMKPFCMQWRSLWITVDGKQGLTPGAHPITLSLRSDEETIGSVAFVLTVLPAALPEQTLKYTEWFHCDCIAQQYGVEMMSEKHWELIEKFARTAVENGINMLLTPVITPSLDTQIGSERPTMQLVRVDVTENGGYAFGFAELDRWFEMCDRVGVTYYEIAHLFTQWGANFAPKIMGWKNGQYTRLFGWENDALSPEYVAFLNAFLPALVEHLKAEGRFERCYFHLSDEPHPDHAAHYKACRAVLAPYLPGERLMDALSSPVFWDEGIVQLPIPCNNHIEPFLERNVQPLWTYYCCSQTMGVSNKFLAQPGSATRIIGTQMYKYHVSGFLQWGYNFYNASLSRFPIDPWKTCEGDMDWPSGDPFCVYPGKDGPVESMRLVTMNEGLQDMRAMQLLEEKKGHDFVVSLIDEGIEPIRFDSFPREESYLLKLREKINAALCD